MLLLSFTILKVTQYYVIITGCKNNNIGVEVYINTPVFSGIVIRW